MKRRDKIEGWLILGLGMTLLLLTPLIQILRGAWP